MRGPIRQTIAVLTTLALLPAAGAAQQGTAGSITGRVIEQGTQEPVAQAQVAIVGTTHGTLTDDRGVYRITDVPAGSYTLRILRIGYQPQTRAVVVSAGAEATADFTLVARPASLEAVITTATGESERKRENGSSVGAVQVDSLIKAPINTFSDVLSSRVAGVTVSQSSGTTGVGSRIRIRGSNSISLSNDPLIIIDGIRADNASNNTFDISVGDQEPSRWNDINPEDIANIEVIKGPAASALYGTAAANGVIYITTKRGQQGTARFTAFAETGALHDEINIPGNYAQIGTLNVGGARTTNCNILFQGKGLCTPIADSLISYSPLAAYSPFRTGNRMHYGLSVSGGSNATTYYASGSYEREQGIYENNRLRNVNLRTNIHSQLRDNLDMMVSAGYVDSRLSLPQNDDNFTGVLTGGLLGTAFNDPISHGFFYAPPDELQQLKSEQDVQRFTGSISGNYLPISWLTLNGTAGLDFVNRQDGFLIEPGIFSPAVNPDLAAGQRQSDPWQIYNYTANGSATAKYDVLSNVEGKSTIGVQYNRSSEHGTTAFGESLAPGTSSLNGANTLFSVGETNQAIVTLGYLAQQQFAWRDRVFLTGAIRTDQNSAFGTNYTRVYYPAASLSWVVSEEPFFPKSTLLSSLRLRTAYGTSGQNPQFRQAITYYTPTPVALGGSDVPGVFVGGTGNANLKPERSTEFEGGFDADVFASRAHVEFTYYHKLTTDALVAQNLAPSIGTSTTRFVNLGEVRNTGLEFLVNARLLDTRPATFDLAVNGSTNHNTVVNLGAGIAPILFEVNTERFETGYPEGAYFQVPIKSVSDANHDGIIEPNEITLGDSATFLGTPYPTREFSITPTLTLFKFARISGLFDYRGGMKLVDLTEWYRCAANLTCRGIQDRTAPLADQAAAVAATALGTMAGYIEDASFWKLREVSVTLDAPSAWASRARVAGLSLTLAGRNLATWTKYKGFDPEVNGAGTTNFGVADFNTQPPVRYYTARVNVTW